MAHAPTPDDVEHVAFWLKWYQELLGGIALSALALYWKAKGKRNAPAIVPLSQEEIEHRMEICRLTVLQAVGEMIDAHEEREIERLDKRDEKLLSHIKDIVLANKG